MNRSSKSFGGLYLRFGQVLFSQAQARQNLRPGPAGQGHQVAQRPLKLLGVCAALTRRMFAQGAPQRVAAFQKFAVHGFSLVIWA